MNNNSGIYKIKNILNNKFYIGSAVNLTKRKCNHFLDLRLNKHCNVHLQRAYNKYGKKSFEFIKLIDSSIENLIRLEQHFIDSLKPEYNICKIAGSQLGLKRNNESKKKMREAHLGKKQSIETINKRAKIHQIPIIQLTKNNEFIQEFDSAKQASEILKINASGHITSCCRYKAGFKTGRKTAGGFKWMYKTQYINNYIKLDK